MEVKKTYEYSVYKNVNLSINFKDAVEYSDIMAQLNNNLFNHPDPGFMDFCGQLKEAMESTCS